MNTHTLGAIVFVICGMIVLVGLLSSKPVLSGEADGYETYAIYSEAVLPADR